MLLDRRSVNQIEVNVDDLNRTEAFAKEVERLVGGQLHDDHVDGAEQAADSGR